MCQCCVLDVADVCLEFVRAFSLEMQECYDERGKGCRAAAMSHFRQRVVEIDLANGSWVSASRTLVLSGCKSLCICDHRGEKFVDRQRIRPGGVYRALHLRPFEFSSGACLLVSAPSFQLVHCSSSLSVSHTPCGATEGEGPVYPGMLFRVLGNRLLAV